MEGPAAEMVKELSLRKQGENLLEWYPHEAVVLLLTVNSNRMEDETGLSHYDFLASHTVPGAW